MKAWRTHTSYISDRCIQNEQQSIGEHVTASCFICCISRVLTANEVLQLFSPVSAHLFCSVSKGDCCVHVCPNEPEPTGKRPHVWHHGLQWIQVCRRSLSQKPQQGNAHVPPLFGLTCRLRHACWLQSFSTHSESHAAGSDFR